LKPRPTAISGSEIVGAYYNTPSFVQGYVYNGSTYTTLDDPSAVSATVATGVSGSSVVGYYTAAASHGFICHGTSFATLDDPNAGSGSGQGTFIYGVSGNNIVGNYIDSANVSHGFLYNGSGFVTLDDPAASETANLGTFIRGISSSGQMVGYCAV
jgi:hypothetical protein